MSSISIFDPDVDAEALHTRVADLAVPCSSYTNSAQILEIARRENASMVHPGYGFLSEDAGFAQQCGDSGITFVGPSPAAVALFGDKTRARQLAMDCGVPVLPGSMEAFADLPSLEAYLAAEAAAGRPLAYPLLLKAVNGGGGRGQRLVREPAELAGALDRCLSEARAFGGDGGVFVESFLESASHIEVQVLGDQGGALVHLFERDCSVQRGNQKVVEIAPAIHMHPELRRQLCEAALKIAAKAGYSNAGTVEFLVDHRRADAASAAMPLANPLANYYFLEVNPRIQVEHTVTEELTGVDLVQAQLLIAAGRTAWTASGSRRQALAAPTRPLRG